MFCIFQEEGGTFTLKKLRQHNYGMQFDACPNKMSSKQFSKYIVQNAVYYDLHPKD